jgi:hypothetical protein
VDELPEPRRIRASDAERERVARFLAAAFEEGRLDLVEYDSRVEAAYAAVYRNELMELVHDLPTPDRPLLDGKDARDARAVPVPAARPRVPDGDRRPYGWPIAVVLFVAALCLARIGMLRPSIILVLIIGLGLVLHLVSGSAPRRPRR